MVLYGLYFHEALNVLFHRDHLLFSMEIPTMEFIKNRLNNRNPFSFNWIPTEIPLNCQLDGVGSTPNKKSITKKPNEVFNLIYWPQFINELNNYIFPQHLIIIMIAIMIFSLIFTHFHISSVPIKKIYTQL